MAFYGFGSQESSLQSARMQLKHLQEGACCVMGPYSIGVHFSGHGQACISHDSHGLVY